MLSQPSKRIVFAIWIGWVGVMLGYQALVTARLELARPDRALNWTPAETAAGSQDDKLYLNDPFLNRHVSWDSEFYLAIALGGYEDPNIQRVGESFGTSSGPTFWPFVIPEQAAPRPGISLSYAFFPFYPMVIRLFSLPLSIFGLNPIATASLAGVVVSLLGTLAAMLALFEMGRTEIDDGGGLRAAFYLLIYPGSLFLAQIYTEGLFVGLAFSSLVLVRRGHRGWAALLAVFATFTRAVGVMLVIPLLISWVREGEWMELDLEWRQIYYKGLPWKAIGHALVVLAPFLAIFVWRVSYFGMAFGRVEAEYFGRGFLSLPQTYEAWSQAFDRLTGDNLQAAAYYAIEFGTLIFSFAACIAGLRRYPDLAWFGLLVVFFSFASGPAQGMHRYSLAAPPVFLFLSELGRRPAFDRVWSIAGTLLMGLMAIMFTFDMWAG
jgi:hypothetical protein